MRTDQCAQECLSKALTFVSKHNKENAALKCWLNKDTEHNTW